MILAATYTSTSVQGYASWASQAFFSYVGTSSGEMPLAQQVCEVVTSNGAPKLSRVLGVNGYTNSGAETAFNSFAQTRGRGGAQLADWASDSGSYMFSRTGSRKASYVEFTGFQGPGSNSCNAYVQSASAADDTFCPNGSVFTYLWPSPNYGPGYSTRLLTYCSGNCSPIPYDAVYLADALAPPQTTPATWYPVDVAVTVRDQHTLTQMLGKDLALGRMSGGMDWLPIGYGGNTSDTNRVEAIISLSKTYTGIVDAFTANRTTQTNSNVQNPPFGQTGLDVGVGNLGWISTASRTVEKLESRSMGQQTINYNGAVRTANGCADTIMSGATGLVLTNTNFHFPRVAFSGNHNRMGARQEDVFIGSYHVSTSSGNFLLQPPEWTTGSILPPLLLTTAVNQPGSFILPSTFDGPIAFSFKDFLTIGGSYGLVTSSLPTFRYTGMTSGPSTITTATFSGTGTQPIQIRKFTTYTTGVGGAVVTAQIVSIDGGSGYQPTSAPAVGAALQEIATIDVSLVGVEPCQYPSFFSTGIMVLTTRASSWALSQSRETSAETLNWPYVGASNRYGASTSRGASANFLGETMYGIPNFIGDKSSYYNQGAFIASQSEIVSAITYQTMIDPGLLPSSWTGSLSTLASLGHAQGMATEYLAQRWGQTAFSAGDSAASITYNLYSRDSMFSTSKFPQAQHFIEASHVPSNCPETGLFVLRTSVEKIGETNFVYREWIGHASTPAYMTIQGGIPPVSGAATPASFLTDYKAEKLTLVACIRATGKIESFTNVRAGVFASPPPFGTFLLHNAIGMSSDGNLTSGVFKASEWQNVFSNNWYATSKIQETPRGSGDGVPGMCAIVASRSAQVPLIHSRFDVICNPLTIFPGAPIERMITPNNWQPERKLGVVSLGLEPSP